MKKPVFVKGKNSSRYNLTHDSERLEGDRTISPVRGKIGSAMGSNRVALEAPFFWPPQRSASRLRRTGFLAS